MSVPIEDIEYVRNVLNQCAVSLQGTQDYQIMQPEIYKAIGVVDSFDKSKVADTPDIKTIKENNTENWRT